MIALSGDRTLLLRVFARRVSPCDDGIVVSSTAELPSAEVVALFSDSPRNGELPQIIVIAKSNLREFFAWASTYLGHWSPLTSRVRVLRRSEMSDMYLRRFEEERLTLEIRRGFASLIIGEALCEWTMAGEKSSPTLMSLRSTFSFAAFGALRRRQLDVISLYDAWERAQQVLKLGARRIERSLFVNVWQTIAHCFTGSDHSGPSESMLAELIKSMKLPASPLTGGDSLFGPLGVDSTKNRREDAVIDLEKWLARKGTQRPADKLSTACMATRLSQAALSHFEVLAKMTHNDAEVLLWYSFISGFLASEPSSQNIERLLFRICGELESDAHEQCGDISVDELEVLTQSDGQLAAWVHTGATYLNVELTPAVYGSFRLRERGNGVVRSGGAREVESFDTLLDRIRALYHERAVSVKGKRRRK